MLRKVGKSRYAEFNGAGPGAPGSRPDLPRRGANRAMPRRLIPARAPRPARLHNEPEIALRDPHSLAVCGRNPHPNSTRMPMRHTHTNALFPAFPGFAPPAAFHPGNPGRAPRTSATKPDKPGLRHDWVTLYPPMGGISAPNPAKGGQATQNSLPSGSRSTIEWPRTSSFTQATLAPASTSCSTFPTSAAYAPRPLPRGRPRARRGGPGS